MWITDSKANLGKIWRTPIGSDLYIWHKGIYSWHRHSRAKHKIWSGYESRRSTGKKGWKDLENSWFVNYGGGTIWSFFCDSCYKQRYSESCAFCKLCRSDPSVFFKGKTDWKTKSPLMMGMAARSLLSSWDTSQALNTSAIWAIGKKKQLLRRS